MLKSDGVKLVLSNVMATTPDQHDPDWPKYPETILFFSTTPPITIDLREIVAPDSLNALKRAGLGEPFAIMTAYDPKGEDLPKSENEKRRRDLNDRLSRSGYRFTTVDCCSPDRSHCECSVAVVMPRADAISLAKELAQVAIFWFDSERFWILGALVDTDPLMLPRSS
ncbi:MAG TPA: DUF3293 domain-containing protein [Gemmatimonadaceae bacterium]|jgi:hypothetical protein